MNCQTFIQLYLPKLNNRRYLSINLITIVPTYFRFNRNENSLGTLAVTDRIEFTQIRETVAP